MAGSVKEFTDGNWKSEVLDSPIPVVVDFWAPWCGPCRMLGPTIEKLAGDYEGKVKVGKMNTDENQETPGSLRISAIPTVLVFKDGKEVDRLVGVNGENKFKDVAATSSACPEPRPAVGQGTSRQVLSTLRFCRRFCEDLSRVSPVVGVKICGLTCVEDALACAEAGVDWIGLNFHPGSPRFIEPARAAAIIGVLPASVSAVGVFVDRPAAEVAEIAERPRSQDRSAARTGTAGRPPRTRVIFRSSGHFD